MVRSGPHGSHRAPSWAMPMPQGHPPVATAQARGPLLEPAAFSTWHPANRPHASLSALRLGGRHMEGSEYIRIDAHMLSRYLWGYICFKQWGIKTWIDLQSSWLVWVEHLEWNSKLHSRNHIISSLSPPPDIIIVNHSWNMPKLHETAVS